MDAKEEQVDVPAFDEIAGEFIQRVHAMVWCNVATVDTMNRPRSRVLHPIWDGPDGWILTRRDSHKARHLSHNPYVSLAYIADVAKPVYVDCTAEWRDDMGEKQRIWTMFMEVAPPLGYDPAPVFERVDHPNLGLLKLTPWRVALVNFPEETRVWRRQAQVSPQ